MFKQKYRVGCIGTEEGCVKPFSRALPTKDQGGKNDRNDQAGRDRQSAGQGNGLVVNFALAWLIDMPGAQAPPPPGRQGNGGGEAAA